MLATAQNRMLGVPHCGVLVNVVPGPRIYLAGPDEPSALETRDEVENAVAVQSQIANRQSEITHG